MTHFLRQRMHLLAAAAVFLLAATVLFGWAAQDERLVQIRPGYAPMQLNTALGFLLSAVSLAVAGTRWNRLGFYLGAMVVIFAAATLLEDAAGWDLGIDRIFYRPPAQAAVLFPGGMPPLTAACFCLLGVALAIAAGHPNGSGRATGLLACIVGVVASVALCGYLLGISPAYGWGPYAGMALHTAAGFLVLSASLLAWSLKQTGREGRNFTNWLPATASLTLLVMIGGVIAANFEELKKATDGRLRSYQTLASTEALIGDLFDSQRGMREYILTGNAPALEIARKGRLEAKVEMAKIAALVGDNPAQSKRLKIIGEDFEQVAGYSHSLTKTYEELGLAPAIAMESSGQGFALADKARADLEAFIQAEYDLAGEGSTDAAEHFQNTGRLLVLASGVVGLLILLANGIAHREITRRFKADVRLHEAASLQKAILNSANYAIISATETGLVTSFNSTAERWLGYDSSEVVGKTSPAIWHDRGEVAARAAVLSAQLGRTIEPGFTVFIILAEPGKADETEWTFIRKDGSRFPGTLSVTALTGETGQVTGYLGVISDITMRKEGEEALRLSEEKFSNAFEHATTGMALVSLVGRWMKVNQALCNLLGYTAEELGRKTFQDITHPDDLDDDLAEVRRLVAGETAFYKMEKRYLHKDGRVVWALLGVSLLRDKQGQPLHFISQIEDISQIKLALIRQEELTRKAQVAEKAKSEFLAIMSHEIRTPMNGVLGMTTLLADTPLDEMQRDYVNTIQTSGESLLSVINDILDYSKIEAGRLQMEARPFNLERCIEESFDLFAAQIRMKRLEVVYFVGPEVPLHLLGDPFRLRQILANLIGNSIKFTGQGEIVITVELQKSDEAGCHLLFSVDDTGIGIPSEDIEKLFQPFQQVDTSTTRQYGGTGLGLIISKRLVEFMGGKMWVESTPGAGSTFSFNVALKAAAEFPDDTHLQDAAGLKGLSVLLVDDNDTNRRILEAQLKIWGLIPTPASSGVEALEKIAAQRFDMALLDHEMPEMNGIALARKIRRLGKTPLMLLSSSGEQVVGEDATFFRHQMSKPLKHSHLLRALHRMTGRDGGFQAPEKEQFDSTLAARHPLSILLAEDNATNQKVVSLMLARMGYSSDLAVNGRKAVEAAQKGRYDLILMDLQMPEMNGLEAMKMIRDHLGENSPKIIALTAEALEGDESRLLLEGFDDYLSKPLQTHKLQAKLRGLSGTQR